jgi:hypothetical protein
VVFRDYEWRFVSITNTPFGGSDAYSQPLLRAKRHAMLEVRVKRRAKRAYTVRHLCRRATAPIRTLPDFVVIGAQKCGTSFLYRLLVQHPDVKPAFVKEVHYFDLNFGKGDSWYRSRFPLQVRKKRTYITGESSPYYLFHPHAPRRAATVIPEAKLIVLLRNPVDRAYSHYQHQVARVWGEGHETLTFEEAIEAEERRLAGELEKLLRNEQYDSRNYRSYSYLSRGIYIDQIAAWLRFFDRDQMLILRSEDLFINAGGTLKTLLDFLGLAHWTPKTPAYIPNKREYTDLSPAIRQQLDEYFRLHNRRLYEFLGVDFGW